MATKEQVLLAYFETGSIRAVVRSTGISHSTVRRILITEGVIPTPRSARVKAGLAAGLDVDRIAQQLKISRKAVLGHSPYIRCSYVIGEKSKNADYIAHWRKKRQSEGKDGSLSGLLDRGLR